MVSSPLIGPLIRISMWVWHFLPCSSSRDHFLPLTETKYSTMAARRMHLRPGWLPIRLVAWPQHKYLRQQSRLLHASACRQRALTTLYTFKETVGGGWWAAGGGRRSLAQGYWQLQTAHSINNFQFFPSNFAEKLTKLFAPLCSCQKVVRFFFCFVWSCPAPRALNELLLKARARSRTHLITPWSIFSRSR